MSFSVNKKPEASQLVLDLKGNIDEDANFAAPDVGSFTTIVLDLAGVTAINSVGIREWIKWIKAFPASAKLKVRHVPKIIVDQINMVAGFLPPGTVIESFYVPYYSDNSGSEKMILFQNGKEYDANGVHPPEEVKDDSGEVMEMDVIEAKYFKFLKSE